MKYVVCWVGLLSVLAGCDFSRHVPLSMPPPSCQTSVAAHPWVVQLWVSVRYQQSVYSAKLHWQENPQRRERHLYLLTPMGANDAELSVKNGHAVLHIKNRLYRSHVPEALLKDHYNFYLPFTALAHWLQGVANEDTQVRSRSADGALAHVSYHGWEVYFSHYQCVNNHWVPKRLILKSPEGWLIQLSVKQWHF